MTRIFPMLLLLLGVLSSYAGDKTERTQSLIDLRYTDDYTPTYKEVIAFYEQLDNYSEKAKMVEAGMTDAGKPLHLLVLAADNDFDPVSSKENGKAVLLINNGIHPGEPCGIDASLKFADELVRNVDNLQQLLKTTTICIVPVYNVGGHLNRSAYNRANQIGPAETGFRGNARNLDLNRDFIKCDSKNARSFNAIFTQWEPDVFLDTHTTNGSDHQYAITLIPTNPAALPAPMSDFLRHNMLPALFHEMQQSPFDMTPYVAWMNRDPEKGIQMTYESPRFSTGYSRLHHAYGFMTENHVYKRYTDRVLSVYHFIKNLAVFTSDNSDQIIESRAEAIQNAISNDVYHFDYEIDTTQFELFTFKGYKAGDYESAVTGLKRFGYDRDQPFEKKIKYYTTWQPSQTIEKPKFYILPSAWQEAVDLMVLNGVEMQQFTADIKLEVAAQFVTQVSHPDRPYNGHYFHDEVETVHREVEVQVYEGDYLIPLHQEKVAYIIECLEPKAADSFFRWNFFDSMLDRREYFSPWGFEENAMRYLNEYPEFKAKWEKACQENPELIGNHYAQMAYIYANTEWVEDSFMRYPVFSIGKVKEKWFE